MSNAYAKKLEKDGEVDMREWCQRPGNRDEDGNILYFTEQAHKDVTDINKIIEKYDKHGLLSHVQTMEARYGDVTGVDFRNAQDLYIKAQNSFEALPANIKKRFNQSAADFLDFMDDPNNRDEAIELGLIRGDSPEDKDGLGEHVTEADFKKIKEDREKDGERVTQPA